VYEQLRGGLETHPYRRGHRLDERPGEHDGGGCATGTVAGIPVNAILVVVVPSTQAVLKLAQEHYPARVLPRAGATGGPNSAASSDGEGSGATAC
jgi:hypothetical protein